MSFEIRISERALRDLHQLPLDVRARVISKLRAARADPTRFFRRLQGASAHRLRVGDYRVVAQIDARKKTIDVVHVAHRKNVYE